MGRETQINVPVLGLISFPVIGRNPFRYGAGTVWRPPRIHGILSVHPRPSRFLKFTGSKGRRKTRWIWIGQCPIAFAVRTLLPLIPMGRTDGQWVNPLCTALAQRFYRLPSAANERMKWGALIRKAKPRDIRFAQQCVVRLRLDKSVAIEQSVEYPCCCPGTYTRSFLCRPWASCVVPPSKLS
jgi:hypothetical protein